MNPGKLTYNSNSQGAGQDIFFLTWGWLSLNCPWE